MSSTVDDLPAIKPLAWVAQFCGEWKETTSALAQPVYSAAQVHEAIAADRAARQAVAPEPVAPIDVDEAMARAYIPLPGGWEVQTKGKGSSFRICDTKTGERHLVPECGPLHGFIERMAREVHAAAQPPASPQPAPQAARQAGLKALPEEWAPGTSLFKDWCVQWFGPDSDEDYLLKAAKALLSDVVVTRQAGLTAEEQAEVMRLARDLRGAFLTEEYKALCALEAYLRTLGADGNGEQA